MADIATQPPRQSLPDIFKSMNRVVSILEGKMNPILQGLQEGYGEEEILSFLSKAIPQLGNSIK